MGVAASPDLFNKREEEGKGKQGFEQAQWRHHSPFLLFQAGILYLLQGRAEVAHMLELMSRKMR
jgi:hypothetical protein